MPSENGLILPPGVAYPPVRTERAERVIVDNQTDLPDEVVHEALGDHWVENASVMGMRPQSFEAYNWHQGSMLARGKWRPPHTVREEIRLARELAERDDDIGATIGMMLAVAFADGMQNFHEDDRTTQLFNGVAKNANLDGVLKEMYREFLIAGSVTTVSLFTREQLEYSPDEETAATVGLAAPLIGVLPAEQLVPLNSDLFGRADLGFIPHHNKLRRWLEEYFSERTTAARRAELRREDPVSAAMFVEQVKIENDWDYSTRYAWAYKLNPSMVERTSLPKGQWPHARPLLTRNLALLEAKRLLNVMDFALLQGGSNFIVVAKKGSDERPALPEEITALSEVVRHASRSGVIVGDHRLSFEIITPQLDALLNADKRKLLGRKLAMGLLRVPEHATDNPGTSGTALDTEMLSRVIAGDRNDLRRHVERVYEQTVKRNPRIFNQGSPRLWFPKIILQGSQYFTDFVLKLRDRGDIPRKFAVEAGGFDWEAGVAQRKREVAAGTDETMAPAAVPFSNAQAGPQDNNPGRPVGSGPNNGAPNARPGPGRDNVRPLRTINRNAGETVKAVHDDEHGVVRVGEQTYAILEQYPEREVGRITPLERRALAAGAPTQEGPVAVIPVNPGYDVGDVRAVRLATGLSLLVGERRDGAIVAKALCFREPEYDLLTAEETALRWGFPIAGWEELEAYAFRAPAELGEAVHAPAPTVIVNAGQRVKKIVHRDEHGNITAIEEVPVDAE